MSEPIYNLLGEPLDVSRIDLQSFIDWCLAKSSRSFKIELKDNMHGYRDKPNYNLQIWCFDYDLATGQLANYSASEINLEEKARKDAERQLEKITSLYPELFEKDTSDDFINDEELTEGVTK